MSKVKVKEYFKVPDNVPDSGSVKAQCLLCKSNISGNVGTTSNFITHLKKKHREVFMESRVDEKPMDDFVQRSGPAQTEKYRPSHPQQKAVTDSLVNFIAGNLLPLSLVESAEFKSLLEQLDPKYQLPSRKPFSTKIVQEKSNAVKQDLKSKLQKARSVSLTIDLWSNRQMKGYIGITGHFILNWTMESVMIARKRFKGRHTAENIRQEYEEALASFDIAEKICSIVSDNASNMTRAFDFSLPGFTFAFGNADSESEYESCDDVDDTELIDECQEISLPEQDFPEHYRCYAHTLQLVVKDGLKCIGAHLRNLIEKVATIVKFARKSLIATEVLEGEKRLQSANDTRWNSQIIMIRSVLNVPEEKLNKLETVHLTKYERKLLQELCTILKPFEDATLRVQTDKNVSASLAVPATLGIEHRLCQLSFTYNSKTVAALNSSVERRLSHYKNYDAYVMAAILDPRFKLRWTDETSKKAELEDKLLLLARQQCVNVDNEQSSPLPKEDDDNDLFSFMTPSKRARNMSGDPVQQEIKDYLAEQCNEQLNPVVWFPAYYKIVGQAYYNNGDAQ